MPEPTGLVRPKHIHTEQSFLRSRAIIDAKKVYDAYSANLNMSQRLAKLTLACLDISGPRLSETDIAKLYMGDFLLTKSENPTTRLTGRGVIAVNMVGVEVYDRDDLDYYLREPFLELNILSDIHSMSSKSSTTLA